MMGILKGIMPFSGESEGVKPLRKKEKVKAKAKTIGECSGTFSHIIRGSIFVPCTHTFFASYYCCLCYRCFIKPNSGGDSITRANAYFWRKTSLCYRNAFYYGWLDWGRNICFF